LPADVPFVELHFESATADYVRRAAQARHGRFVTWLHGFLSQLWSDFEVNGWFDLYPMFVLSTEQWRFLLDSGANQATESDGPLTSLLDIGAGRGDVSSELARLFAKTTVTETSRAMCKRLRQRGFEVIEGDLAQLDPLPTKFDAVSLLNVLDRCDKPLSLLSAARVHVRAGGLLIIALVLPYEPVLLQSGQARPPTERLPIAARTFEGAATELVEYVLKPLGLEVLLLSRTPYLSGGDAGAALYELDDLIVVCRADAELPVLL